MKKKLWESPLHTRVYHKNTFFRNKISPTRQASAWGLVWRNPKGFLISTMFRGSSSHFRFHHFYIVDFHSALTFLDRALWSEGWVKIYNVKMVKTNPQVDAWRVGLILFLKKSVFLVHPTAHGRLLKCVTMNCASPVHRTYSSLWKLHFSESQSNQGCQRKIRTYLENTKLCWCNVICNVIQTSKATMPSEK